MVPFTPSFVAALAAFSAVAQASTSRRPSVDTLDGLEPRQAAIQFYGTSEGCYSSPPGNLHSGGSYTWQSSGHCGKICTEMGFPVMALKDSNCYCGDELPSTSSSVSDSSCSITCPGYEQEPCGGPSEYTVWITGLPGDVTPGGNSESNKHPTSPTQSPITTSPTVTSTHSKTHSHPTHTKSSESHKSHIAHHKHHAQSGRTSTVTKSQKTETKTVTGPPTDPPSSKSDSSTHGPSVSSSSTSGTTIALVVGIVAGVLVFAALVALLLFYLRRRRRMKNAENGHRRADSLNAFVASGGHMPGSVADRVPISAAIVDDTRLDPGIMRETRRESVGSFLADNRDYSRRILTVTNPDGT